MVQWIYNSYKEHHKQFHDFVNDTTVFSGFHMSKLTGSLGRLQKLVFQFQQNTIQHVFVYDQVHMRFLYTLCLLSCGFPFVNGGTFTSAQYNPVASWMVNPQSANIRSPLIRFSKIPKFSVRYTSETRPPHALDINEILRNDMLLLLLILPHPLI